MRHARKGTTWLSVCAVALLSGCLDGGDGAEASRGASDPAKATTLSQKEASESAIIADLMRRESVIVPGSPYAKVTDAVLAANARAAEADLRAARLRAVAAEKNWLPTIGPSVSLSSLGDLVTSLIVEQVLFDNGRKKAERVFAAADVEYAAVVLSEDSNARVLTALSLYLASEQGRAEAEVSARAMQKMKHFEWVMQKRVDGGVSDRSQLAVMSQKRAELEADLHEGVEAAAAALAELNAMSVRPLEDLRGRTGVRNTGSNVEPLGVLKAEADKTRIVAQAKMDRAGFLPGVKASQQLGDGGDGALTVGADNGFGFGTAANLKALKAAEDGAERAVSQAREDSARALARLRQNLIAQERQEGEQKALAARAKDNFEIFDRQYESGTRQVLEVANTFETWIDAERERVQTSYKVSLTRLKIAAALGQLVDGSRI